MQLLTPGIDTTVPDCITRDMLDQLVRAATFYTAGGIGGVIVAENAPDVVTNPELATFIWLESNSSLVPNGTYYYYDGSSWQSLSNLSGASITDKSITPVKLSITGASALDILQVKSDGTQFIFTSLINAIVNGTLPVTKLIPPASGNYVLTSIATANAWSTIDALVALITNNTVPIQKLEAGPDRSMMVSFHGANTWKEISEIVTDWIADSAIPIAKLDPTGYVAMQAIRRNATNTAWESYTPVSTQPYYALLVESQPAGTDGGTFTSGSFQTRTLNTIKANQNTIVASLAANRFTIGESGNYAFNISAPAYKVDRHQARLYRTSGIPATALTGTSEATGSSTAVTTRSVISGLLAVTAGDTFEVQHAAATSANTNGFGLAANLGGAEEIYTTVEIRKVP